MHHNQALALFVAGDERAARPAFDLLAAEARPYLEAYLRRTTGLSADQREDVVQDTLARAWRARASYQDNGLDAWHGFLKTTTRHCCVDLFRRHTETTYGSAPLDEAELGECASALETLMDALETQALRHAADALWLGLDPAQPPAFHTRRLLAAQLMVLDGLPWDAARRLLGPRQPGEPPITRELLDTWLTDPGVLRHLAYHTLYYDNDRLAGRLLGLDDPPTAGDLDALGRDPSGPARGPGGWTGAEAAVILWRYRHALLFEQILQRADCAFSADELTLLIDRTLACFPFSEVMVSLLASLDGRVRRALADRGLWQRLAFQYRYADCLPHLDIRDRTQPAYRHVAEADRPEITPGMLNAWLSNGRLLERLARACRGAGGGEDDA